jgi:hypothetical protein
VNPVPETGEPRGTASRWGAQEAVCRRQPQAPDVATDETSAPAAASAKEADGTVKDCGVWRNFGDHDSGNSLHLMSTGA